MKFKELYDKGLDRKVNPAVSASDLSDDTVLTEIVEYVFTQEIIVNLYNILTNIKVNQGSHVGIWINGYYGSGKSHFLKYASYCLSGNKEHREMAFIRLIEATQDFLKSNADLTALEQAGVSLSELTSLQNWYVNKAQVEMVMFNIGDVHDANADSSTTFTKIFWNQFNERRGYNSFNLALAQHLEKALDDDGKFEEFKDYVKSKGYDWKLISTYAIVGVLIIGSFLVAKTAWGIRNERVVPNFRSDYLGDFQKKPGGEKMTTFSDWAERAKNNVKSYITYYVPDSVVDNVKAAEAPSVGKWIGGILLVALITYGLIRLGAIGYFMFLFVGITFGVLMIWPEQFAGIRYFVALVPLLLLGLCNSIYQLVQTILFYCLKKRLEIVPVLGVCVLLFVLIPRYSEAQTYYRQLAKIRRWQQVNDPAMTQYIGAAEWCKKNLEKEAIVVCRKTEIFYYYSKGIRTMTFPQYASTEDVMKMLNKNQPDYVLIDWWYGHAYRTLYPAIMEHPEKFAFIQQWGEYDPKRNLYPTLLFAYKKDKP